MSRENVEVVRRCVDALNDRDAQSYLSYCTSDVELIPATVAVEGAYLGASGIRRFFIDLQDTAPDFRLEIERLEALASGAVLSFERGSATGRASGITFEEQGIPFGTVYEFAEGRVARIRVFADRQKALEAVGLRE